MTDDKDPVQKIAASVDKAKVVPFRKPAEDPPPAEQDDYGDDGGWDGETLNEYGLPEGCPVIPLGKVGRNYIYLNPLREVITLADRDHSQAGLRGLFSPYTDLLYQYWPQRKCNKRVENGVIVEEWITVGFKVSDGMEALMNACSRLGVWKELDRVRGPGGWLDADGGLIFHCGDKLWRLRNGGPEILEPGRHDGFVYVADAPISKPSDEPVPGDVAEDLWDILKSWNFERPRLDPMMMLGMIGCGFAGGALEWRPMGAITGDAASGKSTLQKLIRYLHGPGGIIKTSDASEPGLSRQLGMSCKPVSIDQLESEEGKNEQAIAIIKLARNAASGDYRLRADTIALSRSVFMFSAIILPPLKQEDRRRMAIFRLNALQHGAVEPNLKPDVFADIGSQLKRRLAEQWNRYEHTLRLFKTMLAAAGHNQGGQDQFGTIMAVAHLMIDDHDPPASMLEMWQREFDTKGFRETSDTRTNAQGCLDELCQAQPDVFRGGSRKSIAQIVHEIMDSDDDNAPPIFPESGQMEAEHVRTLKQALAAAGLALIRARDKSIYLAVPYAHRQVAAIFKDTAWKALPGTSGGWADALSRLPGVKPNCTARIAGQAIKCLHVPLALVLPEDPQEKQNG